jgi:hypothetical protein
MKNQLAMRLFSRQFITESVARKQITALSDFSDGLMRPEKCGEFEPIRTPFNPADISRPIQWLAKPGGEFLYRKGNPVSVRGVMWNLSRPPDARFPAGPFTNHWTGEFDRRWADQIGIAKVKEFVLKMFRVVRADFGFLTTEVDLRAKNTVPTSFSYKGMDIESGIPGLYWINFFSEQLGEWLKLNELSNQLVRREKLAEGEISLTFCESADECRTLEVLQKQRTAIEWLGSNRFFDIRFPNRKAETPEWNQAPLQT